MMGNRFHRIFWAGSLIVCTLGAISNAGAQIINLHDQNSTASIDPTSQAGMFHWDIQGQNELQKQWFWYGIGGGPVQSIDSIGGLVVTPKGPNEVILNYGNPGFSISIDYLLTGGTPSPVGGHANADIQESIRIINTSGAVLPFHFYQFSYFNLDGLSHDTVQLGQNLHGLYNEAAQNNGNIALTETVVTPGANRGEVATGNTTLNELNSGGAVNLSDAVGPVGPGAVTWALQWDFNIAPGGSAIISKDKYLDVVIVPEPSTLALLGIGFAGVAIFRRRSTV
jgi:hypothetical protein